MLRRLTSWRCIIIIIIISYASAKTSKEMTQLLRETQKDGDTNKLKQYKQIHKIQT